MDPAAYVLRPFDGDDAITAKLMIERAADAAETWLADGIELAMTRHNGVVEP
jgi:peptidyl-tRNA hydrolase